MITQRPPLDPAPEAVAIIGLAGRFPGAATIDEFWQNLQASSETITFFTEQELEAAGIPAALHRQPGYVNAGAVLRDVAAFDAGFFGYSPREAELIDPQQRIFLECAWEALEHAGHDPERFPGLIGVYGGASISTYLYNIYSNRSRSGLVSEEQIAIANDMSFLTTRVSYKLNLKGPSVNVQTACSTSLVAVHLACQSLLDQECDMALAGGVTVNVKQQYGYQYVPGGPLSSDGHCRAFDVRAEGTVFGDGVGIVVLKRLSEAIEDGDQIYAVIRGSAINNDGSLKVGFTAPSIDGQAEVIAETLANAGVKADTISYVEAHGTGTALGDPIEIQALTKAFRLSTVRSGFCALGSVKTNLGHLVSASGVASLIKTALSIHHQQLVPTLHFTQANPAIDFAHSPFFVNTTLRPWQPVAPHTPLRAGVSSFGFGGTNAHVILESAGPPTESQPSRPWQLLLLSARTPAALDAATARLAAYLQRPEQPALADVAYTLQVGRKAFSHRRMLLSTSSAAAATALETLDPAQVLTAVQDQAQPPVAFLCSGQGTQYLEMGVELYRSEPVFRETFDRCARLLTSQIGVDLRTLIYQPGDDRAAATALLDQTAIAQPAIFALEYALAQLWMSWGVEPQALLGHSIGEYVAACLAEVFSLEDGLVLVVTRGRLMQQQPSGAMLAVPLPPAQIAALLRGPDGDGLSVAAINGPERCVLAGPHPAIDALEARLQAEGLHCRRLHTSHAFHSAMMDPVVAPFVAYLRGIKLSPPQRRYISNVTGTWITAAQATDPAYWGQQLRQPVQYAAGLTTLLTIPNLLLLELGPERTLSTLAKQHGGPSAPRLVLPSLPAAQDPPSSTPLIAHALGRLWLAGVEIDWAGFYQHERRRRQPLPTYPFERQRYWIEPQELAAAAPTAPALQRAPDPADWVFVPAWQRRPAAGRSPATDGATVPHGWLILGDDLCVGRQVIAALRDAGQPVTHAGRAAQFERSDERTYRLDPSAPQHYARLLRELRAQQQLPRQIVYLWSYTAQPADVRDQLTGLLQLVQALNQHGLTEEIALDVVTCALQIVTGEEAVPFAAAALAGLCQALATQHGPLRCRTIDLLPPQADGQLSPRQLDQLLSELWSPQRAPVVAYRGAARWTPTAARQRLEPMPALRTLRPGGMYLLAGALDEAAAQIGGYLAATAQARFVLIDCPPLPPRAAWPAISTAADRVGQVIALVQVLEAQGAEVIPSTVAVTDREQLQALLAEAEARFGALSGVVYSPPGLASSPSLDQPDQVIAPIAQTIQALETLDALLSERTPDLCLLYAGAPALPTGQLSAAATAAVLGAYAQTRSAERGQWTVAIAWQPQTDDLDAEDSAAGLSAAELSQVLHRILTESCEPQIVLSPTPFPPAPPSSPAKRAPAEPTATAYQRPALATPFVAPEGPIEKRVAEICQRQLGIERIGAHDNFFDLGSDSVLALGIATQLREVFSVDVAVNQFYETPTVSALAVTIERLLLEKLEQLSEEEAQQLIETLL